MQLRNDLTFALFCLITVRNRSKLFTVKVHSGQYIEIFQAFLQQNLDPNSFAKSVCPHVTIKESLNRFSSDLMFGSFTKICTHFPRLLEIGQQQQWILHEDLHVSQA